MRFSSALNCPDLETVLKIDEACLTVHSNLSKPVELFGQYDECHQCPLFHWSSILPFQNKSLVVSSQYRTYFEARVHNVTMSNASFEFDEHGGYGWNINSTNSSNIYEVSDADVTFLPILEAVMFFFCFATAWYMVKGIYKRSNPTRSWAELFRIHRRSQTETAATGLLDNELTPRQPRRFRSIDNFRGICIVLMIFVNYGGGKYWFFEHSVWNGITIADLVFPWFMWIMGFCLEISIGARLGRGATKKKIIKHIIKRSLVLIIIGIMLNSVKDHSLHDLRFPGVLQRIGLAFMIVGTLQTLFSSTDAENQLSGIPLQINLFVLALVIAIIHSLVTFCLPVPGCPTGYLGPGGLDLNGTAKLCTGGSAGYIDRLLFGNHTYRNSRLQKLYHTSMNFDPEGLLSTFSSLLTVICGIRSAKYLVHQPNVTKRFQIWIGFGFLKILFAGCLCYFSKNDGPIPINKNLWSLSFVFLTTGLANLVYAFLHYVTDIKKNWVGRPFCYVGMNSLAIYVGHMLMGHLVPFSWDPIYNSHREHLFMNLSGTVLWILIAIYMYKVNVFITL